MAGKKKPRLLGKIALGGLALAGVLVAAIAAAPFFINWNNFKDKATAYLSQSLHHPVSIDSISVGLFDGVILNKVQIANAPGFGDEPLFYNEKAVLRPSLLSLATGKIVVREIDFINPTLFVAKNAKGVFNFSDITGASKKQNVPSPVLGASSAPTSAPNVILNTFHISGGDLSYLDMATGKTTAIHGLNILLSGFSLQAGGNSRLEIELTTENEAKQIPLQLVADFELDLDGQKVELNSLSLKAPSLRLDASGELTQIMGDPKLDIHATAQAKMESIVADLAPPSVLKNLPPDFKASGSIKFDLDIKGRASQPQDLDLKAALSFDKVGVKYAGSPALEDMTGTLSIGPSSAQLPALDFKLGGSPVDLALQAWNYSIKGLMGPRRDLRLNLKYALTSPKLVMEPIMDYASIPSSPEEVQTEAAENARTGGIQDYRVKVPKGVTVQGTIKVGAVQYKQILTGELEHVVELKNQRLESRLKLQMFGGSVENHLQSDLSVPGPKNIFHLQISNVQSDKAVEAAAASFPDKAFLQQIRGKLFGTFSLVLDGHGTGSQAPALNKNLVLNGNFGMQDGVLKKLDVEEKAAAAIPYPAAQAVLRKDISFGQMAGKLALADEKMTLSDFYLSSGADHRQGDLYITASGTEIIGGALDYAIVPRFNPRTLKLAGMAADGLNDDQGWATFDHIDYKGPNMDSAKADYSVAIQNAATKIFQKQLDQAKKDNGKSLIKQLPSGLQKLFGQ